MNSEIKKLQDRLKKYKKFLVGLGEPLEDLRKEQWSIRTFLKYEQEPIDIEFSLENCTREPIVLRFMDFLHQIRDDYSLRCVYLEKRIKSLKKEAQ